MYPPEHKQRVGDQHLAVVKKEILEAYMVCSTPTAKRAIRALCTTLIGSPMETERLLGVDTGE